VPNLPAAMSSRNVPEAPYFACTAIPFAASIAGVRR
jgi:hypothetical protein